MGPFLGVCVYILYVIAAPEFAKRFANGLGVIACVAAEISCLARPQTTILVNLRNLKFFLSLYSSLAL